MSSVFGDILDGGQVEDVFEKFLKKWLGTYLEEVARQATPPITPGAIKRPAEWRNSNTFDRSDEPKYPSILIISTGLSGMPVKDGEGNYRASWILGIGTAVKARTQPEARRLARRYAAAQRSAILQSRDLEDERVEGLTWDDESYTDIPSDEQAADRISSARLIFTVEFNHVVNWKAGPYVPDPKADDTEPFDPWPTTEGGEKIGINIQLEEP